MSQTSQSHSNPQSLFSAVLYQLKLVISGPITRQLVRFSTNAQFGRGWVKLL